MFNVSYVKSSNMATLKNIKRYGKIRDNTNSISTGIRSDSKYKFTEKYTSHNLDYQYKKIQAEIDLMVLDKTKFENSLVALEYVNNSYNEVRNEIAYVLNAATHEVLSDVIIDVAAKFRTMHSVLEQTVEDSFTFTNKNNPIGALEFAFEGLVRHFDGYAARWPTLTGMSNDRAKFLMRHLYDDCRNYINPGSRDLMNESLVQVGIEIKTLEENIDFSKRQVGNFGVFSKNLLEANMEKESAKYRANLVQKQLQMDSINLFSTSVMQSNVELFNFIV